MCASKAVRSPADSSLAPLRLQMPSARAAPCPCRFPPHPSACRRCGSRKVSHCQARCSWELCPAAERLVLACPGCCCIVGKAWWQYLGWPGSFTPPPTHPHLPAALQHKAHPSRRQHAECNPPHLSAAAAPAGASQAMAAIARRLLMPVTRVVRLCRCLQRGAAVCRRAFGGGRATRSAAEAVPGRCCRCWRRACLHG